MESTLSRRRLLSAGVKTGAGAALSLYGLSLAACGGTPSTSTVNPNATLGPATLSLFFWGSTARDKVTRNAITLFQQAHSGVTINSQFTGFDTYWDKLNTQIAGGSEPDIIQMDMRYIKQFVDKGLLKSLAGFSNSPIDLSDFDKGLLDGTRVNGELYGIPCGGNYQTIVYDTTLIEKANVGPVPATFTWASFADYCAKLHTALGPRYGAQDMSHVITAFEVFVRQHNSAELYTSDGKLGFDRSVVEEWFTYWEGMRKSGGCVPPDVESAFNGTAGPQTSTLINGKAVFSHTLSNLYDAYSKATQNKLAMVAMPTYSGSGATPGMYLKASMLFSVGSKSTHQAHAASFIGFTVNNPDAVKALGLDRGVPGSAKGRDTLKPILTPSQQAQLDYVALISTTAGLASTKKTLDPAGAGAVEKALITAATAVSFGQKSAAAGADAFMKDAQNALEQAQA